MRYTLFGRTGLRVSEVALGTGTFGTRWGWGADAAESRRVFDRFAEAGGNFIDSADVYQFGEAEELLADFIAADRDAFVVASKYSFGSGPAAGIAGTGNSRKAMTASLEASLKRLRTDRLDILWVHVSDEMTPTEEILRGFEDAVRSGKTLYVGFSDFPAWRIARGAAIADLRGWAAVAGVQAEYSLAERAAERELLPMADALGIGVTLWSPLAGGLLSGKQRRGEDGRHSKGGGPVRTETGRETAILDNLERVGEALGTTSAEVAIAWVLAKSRNAPFGRVPILGARTPAQLETNLRALGVELTAEQLDALDQASAIELGFPHSMIQAESTRAMVAGGRRANIRGPGLQIA